MPVKVCLIGAGHMGRIHVQKLAQMKDVTLTCIVDVNREQTEEMCRKHGVRWAGGHGEALNSGTAGAVIASPTESHYPIARDLLQNGIHVFVEKPLAATTEQARQLVGLASKKGLILQVGHLERFSPPFRKALQFIDTPLLIQAHRVSGFSGRSTDIDVIHDLMIHDIDLVLSITKSHVRSVWARGTRVLTENIDVANARLEFDNGCTAMLTASRVSGAKERTFSVFEKDRFLLLNLTDGRMLSVRKGTDGKFKTYTYTAAHPDPVRDELREFVRAIRGGRGPLVAGEDGLNALVLASKIKALIEDHIAEKKTRVV